MPDLLPRGPMLASPSSELAPTVDDAVKAAVTRGMLFEMKWDGVRCLAQVEGGTARLVNRNGVDITGRYPDLAAILEDTFPQDTVVLDGEALVFDAGVPSFALTAKRDRLTKPDRIKAACLTLPASFVVFDVLHDRHHDLTQSPQDGRRLVLESIASTWQHPQLRRSPVSEDGATMWQFACTNDLEGLMAKDRSTIYRPGRSKGWVKLKRSLTDSFLVTGFQEGKGKHEGVVGALLLSSPTADGTLVEVGKVGTGFSDAERHQLIISLDRGDQLIVDVEYANRTKNGALRFPSYRGIRSDLTLADITI